MTTLTVVAGGTTDGQRFERLVRPHYEALYRTAYRLTRSVPDAEDLVQETCVRAFPHLVDLEQHAQPRAWLLCVLQRLFIDQTRRYEHSHVSSVETLPGLAFVDEAPGPAEQSDAAIARRRLTRAWDRLEREQQALLALHDLEGYSLAEMTEITGLKQGTLKSKLHRARVKLGRLFNVEVAGRRDTRSAP